MAQLDDRIARNREELKRHPPGNSGRAQALYNLADSLRNRFKDTDDIAALDEAIALQRSVLDLRPTDHPDRPRHCHWLAWCLVERYRKQGTLPDLEEAITLQRAALDLCPEGHPDQSYSLYSLAVSLRERYDERGNIADLEESITLGQAALELRPPGHSYRDFSLSHLGHVLRRRFLKLGADTDLSEAISLIRSALDLRPEGHDGRPYSLHELAFCFSHRYDKQASVADLEESITLGRAALELFSPGCYGHAETLIGLGNALRCRFLKFGANADIEEAISLHRLSLDICLAGHPVRSNSYHSLALCFSNRYDNQASVIDLEEAIALGRVALILRPAGHQSRAVTLYNLADDLGRRFLRLGANADLEEAILFHQSALDLRPVGHPDRLMSSNQLASCLGLRCEQLGMESDLDDLITFKRAILDLHPPGHCDLAKSMNDLLLHLRMRVQRLGMSAGWGECTTPERVALGLRKPGDPDYVTSLRLLVNDLQSVLRKLESASDIHHSPDLTTLLHNLVICVRDVACKGHVYADVDEFVAVARATWRLCPSGHHDHIIALVTLATCLEHRFQQQGAITDLDEAILLYKEALEHCPSGSFDSAPPLHKLAWCLSQRFIKLSSRTDLEDAIKYEHSASTLYPLGHPGRAESLNTLTTYRQLRIKWRDTTSRPDHSAARAIEKLIGNISLEVLKAFPPRLLDTYNGTLCDRGSQILHFKSSQEYEQLVSSASVLDTPSQTAYIHRVVAAYFRYVTLSHRWGNLEPLLREIDGRVIYDLNLTDGVSKLQSFCLESSQHGYLWAWSDTCCIDKESSAELQEAIGSMFSWYRQSTLTMVHLADIPDTGTLASSEWFKRGWTLQELLAPHTLLFFTRDWSLYRNSSSNHKEDSTILTELEQATGIKSRYLTDFRPGVDDARSRLQWASTRFTTRPEDIAYSLFGVFGLHLPVLYGESTENALGRLLAEVISKSGDTSILDWVGRSSTFHSCFPATILSYQTGAPSQLLLSDLTTPPNVGWIWSFFTLRYVRHMHQALSRLPLTQFINFRLILPCIVYRIKTIALTHVDTSTAAHVHRIEATGLEPIEIALSQPFENVSGTVVPHVLIRPWHSNLLEASMTSDASAYRWIMRMQRPFSALLLQELPQNEYRRVASFCHILARPSDSAGVLKGEVTTLTIV